MARGILKSLHGRAFGLGEKNNLYVNQEALGKTVNSVVKTNCLQITTITNAQVLALNATPITIVTAPATGKIAVLDRLLIYKAANATPYGAVGAADDLIARYTNASGAQVSGAIECTGFLDSTSAQTAYTLGLGKFGTLGTTTITGDAPGGVLSVSAAAIVLHMSTGEVTGASADLIVHAYYDVYDHVLASA